MALKRKPWWYQLQVLIELTKRGQWRKGDGWSIDHRTMRALVRRGDVREIVTYEITRQGEATLKRLRTLAS